MTEPRRLSVKALQAKLGQGGAGIPMPQVPGGGPPPPRVPPTRPTPSLSVDSNDVQSEAVKASAEQDSGNNTTTTETAPAATTPVELTVFEENSMNAVALSRPTITAGRRRPSRIANFSNMIPEENRITAKDREIMEETTQDHKRSQSTAALDSSALPRGEAWILQQLAAMEQNFMERLAYLEEENACLKQALKDANIAVPSKPPVDSKRSSYTARFAQPDNEPPAKVVVSTTDAATSSPKLDSPRPASSSVQSSPKLSSWPPAKTDSPRPISSWKESSPKKEAASLAPQVIINEEEKSPAVVAEPEAEIVSAEVPVQEEEKPKDDDDDNIVEEEKPVVVVVKPVPPPPLDAQTSGRKAPAPPRSPSPSSLAKSQPAPPPPPPPPLVRPAQKEEEEGEDDDDDGMDML